MDKKINADIFQEINAVPLLDYLKIIDIIGQRTYIVRTGTEFPDMNIYKPNGEKSLCDWLFDRYAVLLAGPDLWKIMLL